MRAALLAVLGLLLFASVAPAHESGLPNVGPLTDGIALAALHEADRQLGMSGCADYHAYDSVAGEYGWAWIGRCGVFITRESIARWRALAAQGGASFRFAHAAACSLAVHERRHNRGEGHDAPLMQLEPLDACWDYASRQYRRLSVTHRTHKALDKSR